MLLHLTLFYNLKIKLEKNNQYLNTLHFLSQLYGCLTVDRLQSI